MCLDFRSLTIPSISSVFAWTCWSSSGLGWKGGPPLPPLPAGGCCGAAGGCCETAGNTTRDAVIVAMAKVLSLFITWLLWAEWTARLARPCELPGLREAYQMMVARGHALRRLRRTLGLERRRYRR